MTEKELQKQSVLGDMPPSGRSIIKIKAKAFRPTWKFIRDVAVIGIPTAVIQICLALAASLTNIAAKGLPQSDEIIAAYGVVQRLVLIGCYVVMGFMQGYQPVASYAFGAQGCLASTAFIFLSPPPMS